jgi:hypothetical protein
MPIHLGGKPVSLGDSYRNFGKLLAGMVDTYLGIKLEYDFDLAFNPTIHSDILPACYYGILLDSEMPLKPR